MRLPGLLLIVLTTLVGAGCSGHRPPAVNVAGARVADTADDAVELRFALELFNPNTEPLELMEFQYRVDADGSPPFIGRREARATVPPGAVLDVSLPGIVTSDPAAPIDRWRISGTLEYRSPGPLARVLVDLGFPPKAPFRADGSLEN